ncbi:SGNH/GDSL hydrolase family protein [Micromonospora sp. WMMD1082]|uniref:SGNH/GDSL hydrolase family protein n=1 Tax=Micromonospora sp. WMMD1082 TaxID=3016104 RepID=UPI00241760F4|nr:SGNH/GDSL hydrolase family protein [Micromonospora sp. WMMD1082]MDG4793002.1 SGNH/GDSL hydrolase family protein [Micromonospora sp. WMMD1082]
MRTRIRLLAILGSLAATAAVVLAAAPATAAGRGDTYVALGDSHSSGVGAPPYTDPSTCVRSEKAYAPLYAAARRIKSFDFAACAGAVTADLEKQLDRVGRSTRLVTLTIGGNDIGFGSGVATCLSGTEADCAAAAEASRRFSRTELPGRLDRAYKTVLARAPQARLVVLSYPRFFENTPDCPQVPLSLTKRAAINAAVDTLNSVIRERVARTRATFADVQDIFTGHALCGSDPWLNDVTQPGPFHPTEVGYRAGYLTALERAVAPRGQCGR